VQCSNGEMLVRCLLFSVVLSELFGQVCVAQEKAPARLMLKADETTAGPMGGQRSVSCLSVYSDGKVFYASKWSSGVAVVDKDTGKKTRPERTISVEYQLEYGDELALSSFLESKALRKIPDKFAPPHRPVDYFENVVLRIISANGGEKQTSIREFYVASLEEKSRYPSALVLLMDKVDEIEKAVNEKGKPVETPKDCQLKLQE
jgi:hypothetical protein